MMTVPAAFPVRVAKGRIYQSAVLRYLMRLAGSHGGMGFPFRPFRILPKHVPLPFTDIREAASVPV